MSIILALIGFDIYSVCYSSYLSKRDYDDFKRLFEFFEIDKFVNYGTFN
jgi:hypothetical protein